jgi:hypothetical protein
MHMLTMTAIGLLLLAVVHFGTAMLNRRRAGRPLNGHYAFICVWLAVSAVNFFIGVVVAGYGVLTELAVHAVIFGVPAGIAWYLARHGAQRRLPAGDMR